MNFFWIAGLLLIVIFSAIGAIHVYWAFGGSRGLHAVVPQIPQRTNGEPMESSSGSTPGTPVFTPGPVITILVALIFVGGAAGCAALLFVPDFRQWQWGFLSPSIAAYAGSVIFFLRAIGDFKYAGFTKRVRGTEFAWWDDRFFSPLCTGIALCLCVLASGLSTIA